MNHEYFKSFVIGSSWFVFIWFFLVVSRYNHLANYDYKVYTFIAPLFLGLLNVFGFFISQKFKLTNNQRFIITGLIGATIVSIFITLFRLYNFDNPMRWFQQYLGLYLTYLIIFAVVVNLLNHYL